MGINAKVVELSREEWDFRPQPDPKKKTKRGDWTSSIPFNFLPEDESYFCWQYEFSRYAIQSFDYYSQWRAGAGKPADFDSLLDHYWRTDPNGKTGCPPVAQWFYKIWPEWPAKPYLSVPFKERRRRFKQTSDKGPKQRLRLMPLRDIYRYVVAVKAGKATEALLSGRGVGPVEMGNEIWTFPRAPQEGVPPVEIAAFEIDYELSNENLVSKFQVWLEQRRKLKGYERPDRRGSRADRSDLIALGAMRLMDSGLSIRKAMDFSERISGKTLFEDSGDWSKARKRAKQAIYRAC